MTVEEIAKEFLALPEPDRMEVVRRIMPPFCQDLMRNEEKLKEMFWLFTQDCGRPMRNMFSAMSKMMGNNSCSL